MSSAAEQEAVQDPEREAATASDAVTGRGRAASDPMADPGRVTATDPMAGPGQVTASDPVAAPGPVTVDPEAVAAVRAEVAEAHRTEMAEAR
ncbi:hypothetical protein G3I27_28515, partial [Streptomyces sp. SID10692]|nr:hypothetical protein [Streptomyces sp. SID10692]